MRSEAAQTPPPLPDDAAPQTALPPELPLSTVSEIASWLVGHTLDSVERELIRHTLESCDGDRDLAAGVLGISQPALRKRLRDYAVRGKGLPEADVRANDNGATPSAPPEVRAGDDRESPAERPAARANDNGAASEKQPSARAGDEAAPSAQPTERANDKRATPEQPAVRANDNRVKPAEPPAAPEKAGSPAALAPARARRASRPDFRLLAGGATAAAAAAAIVLLIGAFAPTGFGERPRIELSVAEKSVPLQPRTQAPLWAAPVPAQDRPATFDIAQDTRMDAAPAVARAPLFAAIGAFDAEGDTRMERARLRGPLLGADIAADTRLDPPPPLPWVRTALTRPFDSAADTHMDSVPPFAWREQRGSFDTAQDTRLESARSSVWVPAELARSIATAREPGDAPETTGSIGSSFEPPSEVPMPLARAEPPAPVKRVTRAPRPATARPAPPAAVPPETAAVIFPFAALFGGGAGKAGPAPSTPDTTARE